MTQVKGPAHEATMKRVIEQSLTSAKALFLLSALPTEEMTAVHEARYGTWDRRGGGKRKKVVRDLAVMEFLLPWPERAALSFYHRCLERWSIQELSSCMSVAEREGAFDCDSVLIADVLHRLARGESSPWSGSGRMEREYASSPAGLSNR